MWRLCVLPCIVALCCFWSVGSAWAAKSTVPESLRNFSVFRMGDESPTALIVGGIQGDEPGGFSAAALLATRYHVHKGTLLVVPNLNFPSIIQRSRGVYGDMNRKFLTLDKADPEFAIVSRIQELICMPDVKLVLNMHDGSGYYRPQHQDAMHNPQRWGQSIIIDQAMLGGDTAQHSLQELEQIAQEVVARVNANLLSPEHQLHVHNTNTSKGDTEMEKSLSWYAVRHGKAAFGLEATKNIPVETRAFYHLSMVEAFLSQLGITFERDFALNPEGIRAALQSHLTMAFAENRVMLPLENVRPTLNLWPMPRGSYSGIPSMPIMAIVPADKGSLSVHYGNRTMTRLTPDWREMDRSLDGLDVTVDAEKQLISFGQIVNVKDHFIVHGISGYRVNAIGANLRKNDESNIKLQRKDFLPRYSVDKQGTIYRVEVYKGNSFSGMFLVRFPNAASLQTKRQNLPATPRRESSLGY